MPGFVKDTNCVTMSFTEFDPAALNVLGRVVYGLCKGLRLAYVEILPDGERQRCYLHLAHCLAYRYCLRRAGY